MLGVLGARTRQPLVFAGAAGIGLGASVLQFLELALGARPLGGNGSTAAFLAALGIGYGALWYASRQDVVAARKDAAELASRSSTRGPPSSAALACPQGVWSESPEGPRLR